jgi:hypothetical protein
MFDKKAQAEALILADEGVGNVTDTDIHGVHWDHQAGRRSAAAGQPGARTSGRVNRAYRSVSRQYL